VRLISGSFPFARRFASSYHVEEARECGSRDHVNPFAVPQPSAPGQASGNDPLSAQQTNPIAEELLGALAASPDVYPQKLDLVGQSALLIRFSAAAYRSASFLDDRILGPDTRGAWLPLDRLDAAAGRATGERPLHYIFHTGHVGSTLVSRLLDETGDVLSLREPLPLRTLADAHDLLGLPESLYGEAPFGRLLTTWTRLWRRGYATTRAVVLKATSSAGRLAGTLLGSAQDSRAIYMNLRAEPYLATLLAGQNSPLDLRGHGQGRIRRLQARLAAPLSPLHALSLGELAAMSWLAETWAQDDAMAQHPGRVMAIDFERFLAGIPESLGRILGHFGLPAEAQRLAGLARSPVLTHYSKAPEYAYTPAARVEILAQSRAANGVEIRSGMAWLERVARADAAAGAVVDRAERREP
jgi:hypothetical protein